MRKITIEYDESDPVSYAIMRADQALRDNAFRLKPGNIKVSFDKGLKVGMITQKGVSIVFMESKK